MTKILDWTKFGILYGLIVGSLLALAAAIVSGILVGPSVGIIAGVLGIGVLIGAMIIGAIGWTINGFIYSFIEPYINKLSAYWQLVVLGLFIGIGTNIIFNEPIISLGLIIATIVGTWIVLFIAGIFKLQVPVTTKGR